MGAYQLLEGQTDHAGLPDTAGFLQLVSSLKSSHPDQPATLPSAAFNLFRWDAPLYVARAPGRLDVMGGIADYSGSLVLQMPISEACHTALQRLPSQEPQLNIVSVVDDNHRGATFQAPMSDLFPSGQPLEYAAARQYFQARPEAERWAAYIAGCLLVLAREEQVALGQESISILVSSSVPEGKGVSSSAAVEVATMSALAAACGVQLDGARLATICQMVENLVVGAPCGIMDQMASALGQAGRLLALLCQPAEVQGCVDIPSHMAVWGVDSGIRHSVGGSDYGSVRMGAFMGLKILRHAVAGASPQDTDSTASQPKHLVHISPSELQSSYQPLLPASITGAAFEERYGPHIDSVTSISPDSSYAVYQPTAHPIHEHFRVRTFRQLLTCPASPDQMEALGELMMQSHASYGACGLGSQGTDRLVALVKQHMSETKAAGRQPDLYGAKITGGGCGGTVCILGVAGPAGEAAMQALVSTYATESGYTPKVFHGSSMGAVQFGHLKIQLL